MSPSLLRGRPPLLCALWPRTGSRERAASANSFLCLAARYLCEKDWWLNMIIISKGKIILPLCWTLSSLCFRRWSADEARILRVSVTSFMDHLSLVLETMEMFGPPVSDWSLADDTGHLSFHLPSSFTRTWLRCDIQWKRWEIVKFARLEQLPERCNQDFECYIRFECSCSFIFYENPPKTLTFHTMSLFFFLFTYWSVKECEKYFLKSARQFQKNPTHHVMITLHLWCCQIDMWAKYIYTITPGDLWQIFI